MQMFITNSYYICRHIKALKISDSHGQSVIWSFSIKVLSTLTNDYPQVNRILDIVSPELTQKVYSKLVSVDFSWTVPGKIQLANNSILLMRIAQLHMLHLSSSCHVQLSYLPVQSYLGKGPATKSDEFLEKCQRARGEEVIFNQTFMLQILGTFTQGFLSMKSIKRRVFQGSGHAFSTIVLILTDIN